MSESVEFYKITKQTAKVMRAEFGIGCPECIRLFPRAQPKILTPGDRCYRHGYTDPRPYPTPEEERAAFAKHGIEVKFMSDRQP